MKKVLIATVLFIFVFNKKTKEVTLKIKIAITKKTRKGSFEKTSLLIILEKIG